MFPATVLVALLAQPAAPPKSLPAHNRIVRLKAELAKARARVAALERELATLEPPAPKEETPPAPPAPRARYIDLGNMEVGQVGLVRVAAGDGAFSVSLKVQRIISDTEFIATVHGTEYAYIRPFLVSGFDTRKLADGKLVELPDREYRVGRRGAAGGRTLFTLTPVKSADAP